MKNQTNHSHPNSLRSSLEKKKKLFQNYQVNLQLEEKKASVAHKKHLEIEANKVLAERISKLEINMIKEISNFKTDFAHSLTDDFNNQTERLDNRLRLINDKVNGMYR